MIIPARLAASTFLSSGLIFGFASATYAADLTPIGSGPAISAPADLPAVSGFNGKIAAFGGWLDDDIDDDTGVGGLTGAFSVPLGHRFGFQGDGMVATSHGDFVGELGAHLFWRDPSKGLVGVFGEYVTRDHSDWETWRLGIQGEAYLGQITLEGIVGYEDSDLPAGFSDDEDVFTNIDVGYYIHDNFRITGGYRYLTGMNIGAVGAEYQLSNSFLGGGTSLFVEGRAGEDDYAAVWGGVRFYLGSGEKSLIRRHREDDPDIEGDENFYGRFLEIDEDPPCDPEITFCGSAG